LSVFLVIQHAKRLRRIIIRGLFALQYFCTQSKKRPEFLKRGHWI